MRTKSHRETYPVMRPPPGGRLQPIPSAARAAVPVIDPLQEGVGLRGVDLVRLVSASPDKALFIAIETDRPAAERACDAGLLAAMEGEFLYRITAKGEALVAGLARIGEGAPCAG